MKKAIHTALFFFLSTISPVLLLGQNKIEVGKVLNYKLPTAPIGMDNYLFSSYVFHGKKAYNMKGFEIGNAPYEIMSLKYNPTGSSYALLSRNKQKTSLQILDAWTVSKVIKDMKETNDVTAICFSTDSRRFYVADAHAQLSVYGGKLYNKMEQWGLPFAPSIMTASSNGYFIAAADGNKIAIINQENGSVRTSFSATGTITSMTFSDDASLLGVLSRDGNLHIYDGRTFTLINEFVGMGEARSLDFHPDGKYATVLTSNNTITFINLSDESDRPSLGDEDGGLTYLRYLKDGKQQVYLTYNTRNSIKYKMLRGFSPNYTKLLTDELNARMNEWAKMRPNESLEEYQARVNNETRLKQAQLFEQEIATRLADDLVNRSVVKLGSYNRETSILTMQFDNMPPVYLKVPEEEVNTFVSVDDLEFHDVIYGITRDDKFEMTFANVINKRTGKSYEFNNLSRSSLDYLFTDDNMVPIELIQQSSMEEVRLQAIKNEVVTMAKQNNLISDHTQIKVSTDVYADYDAMGNKITNCKIGFNYTVEGKYSFQEDFAAGKYVIEQSHAAISMLEIIGRAFGAEFAQYIRPGKKLLVKVTGSADALKINGAIAYDGCYGDFENEPYYLDNQLNSMVVTRQTGIRQNEQLAFLRAAGVQDYIYKHFPALQTMQTDYQYHIEVADRAGGEYRRISVEFIFIDAFSD